VSVDDARARRRRRGAATVGSGVLECGRSVPVVRLLHSARRRAATGWVPRLASCSQMILLIQPGVPTVVASAFDTVMSSARGRQAPLKPITHGRGASKSTGCTFTVHGWLNGHQSASRSQSTDPERHSRPPGGGFVLSFTLLLLLLPSRRFCARPPSSPRAPVARTSTILYTDVLRPR
jgi:hypothetical protein